MPSSPRVVETKLEPQAGVGWNRSLTRLKDLLHPSWNHLQTECHPGTVNTGSGTKVVPTAQELSCDLPSTTENQVGPKSVLCRASTKTEPPTKITLKNY